MNFVTVRPVENACAQESVGPKRGRVYYAAFDGLRGLAILLVLFFHGKENLQDPFAKLVRAGWCGVDLFFVLSGFLITDILLRTKASSNYFGSFYWRRLVRIFPLYYGVLAFLFFGIYRILPDFRIPPAADHLYYWLYLSNWKILLQMPVSVSLGHFWSLAVEEQFYLVWPAAVYWLNRRQISCVALIFVLGAPLLRLVLMLKGIDTDLIYRNTFCRADSLMMGALSAVVLSHAQLASRVLKRSRWFPLISFALISLTICMFGPDSWGRKAIVMSPTIYGVAFSLMVFNAYQQGASTSVLTWAPLRQIGKWSYGLYVYHLPVYHAVRDLAGVRRWQGLALEIGLTIGIAALSYHFIERHFLKLKKYFEANVDTPSLE